MNETQANKVDAAAESAGKSGPKPAPANPAVAPPMPANPPVAPAPVAPAHPLIPPAPVVSGPAVPPRPAPPAPSSGRPPTPDHGDDLAAIHSLDAHKLARALKEAATEHANPNPAASPTEPHRMKAALSALPSRFIGIIQQASTEELAAFIEFLKSRAAVEMTRAIDALAGG